MTAAPEGPAAGEPDGTVTAGSLGRVTLATVVAGLSGYLVLLLAARHLGAAGYAAFAAFWAAYGMITGTQNGQLQETTRAVRSADGAGASRPLQVNVAIGIAVAVLVAVTAPLWASSVFTREVTLSVALLAGGVASFAVYAHLCGALSGALAWTPFAVLLSVDALLRLGGAVVAVAAGWDLTAFLLITVIGSVSWGLLLVGSPAARRAVGLPGDVTARRLAANTLTAMAAAAASAVLVMGLPVLITATTDVDGPDDAQLLGAVILAVTLTRAPLLVPLNSFQGLLIARFVELRARPAAALGAPLAAVAALGAVGVLAAWLVGPWLLTTVFGAEFRLGGGVLALLMVGATTLGLLTVTGAAAISAGAHRWYAAGWWVATLVSVAVLVLPGGLETRVAAALILGPVVGIAVHLVALARR